MNRLKIKTESLPARCEVCHQADRFDPIINYCSRCELLSVEFLSTSRRRFLINAEQNLKDRFRRSAFEIIIYLYTLWSTVWNLPVSVLGVRRARLMEKIAQGRPLDRA